MGATLKVDLFVFLGSEGDNGKSSTANPTASRRTRGGLRQIQLRSLFSIFHTSGDQRSLRCRGWTADGTYRCELVDPVGRPSALT